jgi:Leucine-rich repeat (LRR) protein
MSLATEAKFTKQVAEMDAYFSESNSEDLSYAELDVFPEFLVERAFEIMSLHFDHNIMSVLPSEIGCFVNLISLDISNNQMKNLSPDICSLPQLRTLIARNNHLTVESIPKDFGLISSLVVMNVSGNFFTEVPMQFTELTSLKCLYLGANRITNVPKEIARLQHLEILYLGGNVLKSIPEEIGYMQSLVSLVLCDNRLELLPNSLVLLTNLQSLSLHNNRLSTLPPEIIHLNLVELSLRNNPLVVRFVKQMMYEPPSLLELSGRVIKVKNIRYSSESLPGCLVQYLDSAHSCVNPKCRGVYFSSHIEHVKFVDFCGKYRVPLLQYLCSPKCTSTPSIAYTSSDTDSEEEEELPVVNKMKKVLLG